MKRRRGLVSLVVLAGLGVAMWLALKNQPQDSPELRAALGLPPEPTAAEKAAQAAVRQSEARAARIGTAAYDDPAEMWGAPGVAYVDAAIAAGRAEFDNRKPLLGTGLFQTSTTTAADREIMAGLECRRAIDDMGMPASQLGACIATIAQPASVNVFDRTHEWTMPGGRLVMQVRL